MVGVAHIQPSTKPPSTHQATQSTQPGSEEVHRHFEPIDSPGAWRTHQRASHHARQTCRFNRLRRRLPAATTFPNPHIQLQAAVCLPLRLQQAQPRLTSKSGSINRATLSHRWLKITPGKAPNQHHRLQLEQYSRLSNSMQPNSL